MQKKRGIGNLTLGLAIVAVASAVCLCLALTRPKPPGREAASLVPEVQLYQVQPCTFDAPVVGHGTVRAKAPLKIVLEVSGGLVHVHTDLAVGKTIPKGELLFEIDPEPYQLKVAQADAETRRLEAQLERQRQEKTNLETQLEISRSLLEQAQRNVEREQDLLAKGASKEVDVEKAQDAYLRQKEAVQGYQSQLDVAPHMIAETQATLDLKRAQLAEARQQVDRTKIRCPFDARVDSISAATSQVVIAGFPIATLTNLEALELAVGLDPSDLEWTRVWESLRNQSGEPDGAAEASVIWSVQGRQYTWRGRLTRLERVDEATRTARVVVEISDALKEVTLENGRTRPPLSIGVFCRVEIPADPLKNALVIPRAALQDSAESEQARFVYVFVPDDPSPDCVQGRLAMRSVPVLRTVEEQVVVCFDRPQGDPTAAEGSVAAPSCELRAGDEVIVSPLSLAVQGMRLRRRVDVRTAGSDLPQYVPRRDILNVATLGRAAPVPGVS